MTHIKVIAKSQSLAEASWYKFYLLCSFVSTKELIEIKISQNLYFYLDNVISGFPVQVFVLVWKF